MTCDCSVKDLFTNYEAGKRGVDCGEPTDFQANCVARVRLARVLGLQFGAQRG